MQQEPLSGHAVSGREGIDAALSALAELELQLAVVQTG